MKPQRHDDFKGCVGVLLIILLLFSMILFFSCTEPIKKEIVFIPTLPDSTESKCNKCGHEQYLYLHSFTDFAIKELKTERIARKNKSK